MKKNFVVLLSFMVVFSFAAFADEVDIEGIIESVNNSKKTIIVNGKEIQVLPQTKIEIEDCSDDDRDKRGKFVDLKKNDLVEVEAMWGRGLPQAKEIEIKCNQRAY